ncbi:hypothetical protein HPB49_014617 [Dermacentor silvarum]|uniref:Uncharacterized protein n=1 Tax=Dermacentor silvarum TaxID=543639 RepID=A0ACB8CXJ8_DERSI|nr:hypothetical protein HPB49_014617 [Dermacentor silvarum]
MRPWTRIGVDLFEYAGNSHKVTYDAFSHFPDVETFGQTRAEGISALNSMLAMRGIPVEVHSDTGLQFFSQLFQRFADKYNFKHTTSSPHFPRSNWFDENVYK